MSHVVEITTQIRDEQAVRAACTRLQLAAPEDKTVRLFNATATGLCVQLPGWNYPLVANLQTGQVIVRSMALPQPCPQAFPSRWAAGEAGAAFSGTQSAAGREVTTKP